MKLDIGATWDNVKDGAVDAWNTVKDSADIAWSTVKDGAGNAWNTAKDGVGDTWNTVKDSVGDAWNTAKDGITEAAETAHEKTISFHENYVSKIIPDCGKYGDEAKFVAEMVPGVAEYNAIIDGDWTAFAIAAGTDIISFAAGFFTAGTGYFGVKGGVIGAKAGIRVATKEIAEAGTKVIVREAIEAGVKKTVQETVEAGVEKAVKEVAKTGVEVVAKETLEAGAKTLVKDTVEAGSKAAFKEVVEAGAERTIKETVESATEKAIKKTVEASAKTVARETAEAGVETVIREGTETGTERAILKVGDKIDITRFPEYIDEIEKITGRKILSQQKELIQKALKENDFSKLSKEVLELSKKEFKNRRPSLIQMWENMTGTKWPRYTADVINEAGDVIRTAGQPFDAHHIIELCTGGPNEWWNLHPARFPIEHQNGIHALGSLAKAIFG